MKNNADDQISDSGVRFSIREEAAPKKTGTGYMVFELGLSAEVFLRRRLRA